jgi:preprotein translocase subunit YajC
MPEQPTAAPGPLAMLFPIAMMSLIFYVLVFRPQSKARKEHQRMLKNLKKHDEVVTSGGLFGIVVNVKPDAITLRVDENVRVEIEPSAIVRLVKPKSHGGESATAEKRT